MGESAQFLAQTLDKLLAEEGEAQRAAVLLVFALGHEQLPAAYSFAARPALDALEASLTAEGLAAAREAAAAADLDELVAEALGDRIR